MIFEYWPRPQALPSQNPLRVRYRLLRMQIGLAPATKCSFIMYANFIVRARVCRVTGMSGLPPR